MAAIEPRLAIVYEHPEWFASLFAELDRRGIAYDKIDISAHGFDPTVRDVPWTLALNRLSPSAYLRGHGQSIVFGREYLRFLESRGIDVVNRASAFDLETSKVGQLMLLQRLGLPAPRTRVINHVSRATSAAEGLAYPVIIKPNIGGSGAGIQRFDSPAELAEAAQSGTVGLGIDSTALVQEFLPARDGHIVRVEVLNGRFLYAIKVYPNPEGGFNLCPADICHPDAVIAQRAAAPATEPINGTISSASMGFCPVDLPKVALRVEAAAPPSDVIDHVLRIARAAGFDLGGVEYLVNDRDGRIYYYDINVLSNFVADAVNVVGFDPYRVLVDYLVERGRLRAPIPVHS